MALPEIKSSEKGQIKKFGQYFFKYAEKIPEELVSEYAKMGEAILILAKENIPDEMVQSNYDILSGFSEFMTRKTEGGKSISEIITENMSESQKEYFATRLYHLFKATGIKGSVADIAYPNATIEVNGTSYTKEAFRQKMYENHWKKGEDDAVIDLMFDGYVMGYAKNTSLKKNNIGFPNNTLEENEKYAKKAMTDIINIPVVAVREKSSKKAMIGRLLGCRVIYDIAYNPVCNLIRDHYNSISADSVAKECLEDDRAEFIRNTERNGFNRPEDKELITAVFNGRFDKNGVFDQKYEDSVKLYFENSSAENAEKREKVLNTIKERISAIPEDQRTDDHKKVLTEIEKQFTTLLPVIKEDEGFEKEAKQFQNDIHNNNFCHFENIYYDLYKAGRGLAPDHPYKVHLENLRKGITLQNPEYDIKKDNTFNIIQTYDELDEAMRIMEENHMDDPDAKKAKESIKSFRKSYASRAEAEREKKPYHIFIDFDVERNVNKLQAFADAIRTYDKKDSLPAEYSEIQKAFYDLVNEKGNKLFGQYNSERIDNARNIITEKAAEFIGNLGSEHPLYKKGIEALEGLWPDEANTAKELAGEFDVTKSELESVKDMLESVNKAYFNHDNSPEFNKMVDMVKKAAGAANKTEYDNMKSDLVKAATDYLDHTGLERASKYHSNSEMRRLCAFRIIASEGDIDTIFDYITKANNLRKGEDQITKERLDKLVIKGGKEKVSAKDLLKEDKDAYKKKTKAKKTTVKEKEKKEPEKNGKEI